MNVARPGRRLNETMGVPMGIIANAVKESPELLDKDVLDFAYSIAPEDVYREKFSILSGYVSIKYATYITERNVTSKEYLTESINTDILEAEGAVKVLSIMLKCFRHAPWASLRGFCGVTSLVYSIAGPPMGRIVPVITLLSSYFSPYEESTIMNIADVNFLVNLISSKFNRKIKKLYLCYRASKDGDLAQNFHAKCEYIKNIIIIIKTKNNKKFGGFSTESWETNSEIPIYKKDKDAFIFSLDNYNYYNIINPEKALYCYKKYGPIFGNGEIFIPDNFFQNISHCNNKEVYRDIIRNENKEPLNDEKEFYVEEIEAYKVDF